MPEVIGWGLVPLQLAVVFVSTAVPIRPQIGLLLLQVHGSAPDIAGQDIANPMAMVLSAAMMCRYGLQLPQARRGFFSFILRSHMPADARALRLQHAADSTTRCMSGGAFYRK